MEETRYLDFDLSIERIGENLYRSRVVASPAGLAKAEFSLPVSMLEIENFILRIGRTRRMVRRIESPEMQIAKEFGSKLFKSVFSDDVQSALRSSLDQARAQGVGLRIRLRMNDAPELVDIPWEYLYNPTLNRFLALSVNTPVVRYLELPESIQPLAVKPPLRVLVMIANPKNYPALDVESEWRNLKKAVSDLEGRGLLIVTRLDSATPVALQYSLRREDFHIFHFIGHGGFDVNAQDGLLMLEDENGLGRPLSGQYLGTILHDEDSLRLVILNACEGARTGKNDPFAGTAQALVQQGLPAVIAMQFEVSDQAAITFAHEFYSALADGLPVDAALSEARKVIFSSGNEIEWGTPVLYLRAANGQIFDITRSDKEAGAVQSPQAALPLTANAASPKTDPLYVDALGAYYVEEYEKAAALFQQVLSIDPHYLDAAEKLADANRKAEQGRLRMDIEGCIQNNDWSGGLALLEKLASQIPQDQEIARRLEQARKQVQLGSLYSNARRLVLAEQWQAAVKVFIQMRGVDPDYPDAEGLRVLAEKKLAEQTSAAETEALYAEALKLINAGQWEAARLRLSGVQARQPGYRDSARLVELVKTRQVETEAVSSLPVSAVVEKEAAPQLRKETLSKSSVQPALPTHKIDWPAITVVTLGAWMGWAIGVYWYEYLLYEGLITLGVLGALAGLLLGFGIIGGIYIQGLRFRGKHMLGICLIWVGSMVIGLLAISYIRQVAMYMFGSNVLAVLALAAALLIFAPGSLAMVYSLRAAQSGLQWKTAGLLTAGWLVGVAAAFAMIALLTWMNNNNPSSAIVYISGGVVGMVGGSWMTRVLGQAGLISAE